MSVPAPHVVSLALQTGERQWVWSAGPAVVREGFLYQDRYFVLLASGEVCVLAAGIGELDARLDLQAEASLTLKDVQVARPLLVSESHIWVGSLQGALLAFDRLTGGLAWEHRPEGGGRTDLHGNTFVVARGRLYYADDSQRIYCLTMTTGKG